MNIKFYRIFLFIFGCITSRIGLVLLSANINKEYLPYFGFLTLIPALGFSVIYFFKLRKTGLEVFGDKIWWNSLRPIHSLLYLKSARQHHHNYRVGSAIAASIANFWHMLLFGPLG